MSRILTATFFGLGCTFLLSGCVHSQPEPVPSATTFRDDIQFYPAGPEFKLYDTQPAIEEYKASQAGLDAEHAPQSRSDAAAGTD